MRISYQFIILLMSIYVIIALGIEAIFNLPTEVIKIMHYLDFFVCIVFFYDFLYNLKKEGISYLKWGWLDLLSSIPLIYSLHFTGVARIFRIIKLFRGVKSTKVIVQYILSKREESIVWAVILSVFTLIQFSAIAILYLERDVNHMIQSPEDALWWSYVTMTTVGYGDIVPVTTAGRLVAAVLMSFGVGVFGLLTGFAASWFLGTDHRWEYKILREVVKNRRELKELREQLSANKSSGD